MMIIDFYLAESISKLTVLRDEIVSVEDKASIRQMIAELKAIKEHRLETHPAHTQQTVDIGERVEKANELELYFGAIGLQETEIENLKAAYPHEYLKYSWFREVERPRIEKSEKNSKNNKNRGF